MSQVGQTDLVVSLLDQLLRVQIVNKFVSSTIEQLHERQARSAALRQRQSYLQARLVSLERATERARLKARGVEQALAALGERREQLLAGFHAQRRGVGEAAHMLRLSAGISELEAKLAASNAQLQTLVARRIDELLLWIPISSKEFFHPPPALPLRVCFVVGVQIFDDAARPLDDETLSSVLGVVVHAMVLACSWLDLVLPHQMKFVSSRSLIFRDGDMARLPLYRDVAFDTAFRLLKENVRALCLIAAYKPPARTWPKSHATPPPLPTQAEIHALVDDLLHALRNLQRRFVMPL